MNTYTKKHLNDRIKTIKEVICEIEDNLFQAFAERKENLSRNRVIDGVDIHIQMQKDRLAKYEYVLRELETVLWFVELEEKENGK